MAMNARTLSGTRSWLPAGCLLAAIVSGSAGAAAGQPDADPELDDDSVSALGQSLRDGTAEPLAPIAPTEAAEASPVRSHAPEAGVAPGSEARALTEGSFLIASPGVIARTPSGAWVFAPDASEELGQIKPMILLPSQMLTRLAQLIDDTGVASGLRISGRVTLYRDHNYLLVTAVAQESAAESESSDDTAPNAPGDATEPQSTGAGGLSTATRALIDELEASRTGVRGVIASAASAGTEAHAAIAEGRTITRRRARLVRLDAGELAVAFDNDQAREGDATADQPLVIAPCAVLQTIEELIETHGEASPVIVSGTTLAYAGRSYILPIGIALDPTGSISSRQ